MAATTNGRHRPLAVGAHARGESGRALERKLVAEFIGAFFLVFTVGMASAKTGAGALAIGAVLMVMVFAGGHISGGHDNPTVSLAVMIRGKLKPTEALAYMAARLIAGVVAGLLVRVLSGAGTPAATSNAPKILIVEFLFTFALAYVVLYVATADGTRDNSFYGLAIGFTVVAGALAVGGICGDAFNPAVALGGSVLGIFRWTRVWIYVVADLLGGSVAAGAFLYLDGGRKERARSWHELRDGSATALQDLNPRTGPSQSTPRAAFCAKR